MDEKHQKFFKKVCRNKKSSIFAPPKTGDGFQEDGKNKFFDTYRKAK
jgi:hypothetical protein